MTTGLFSRPLWPQESSTRPPPFALKHVIIDGWLDNLRKLGLDGLATVHTQDLEGMHLIKKLKPKPSVEPKMVNNVTLNFSNGASFTGPLAVGQNIKISYDAAGSSPQEDLRGRLEEMVAVASTMIEVGGSATRAVMAAPTAIRPILTL